jgi:hypothetical protein
MHTSQHILYDQFAKILVQIRKLLRSTDVDGWKAKMAAAFQRSTRINMNVDSIGHRSGGAC